MSDPLRRRVADAAARAGYGPADLEQIAVALWEDYTPGDRLDTRRLTVVADTAIELCADSLIRPGTLLDLLAAYRAEHGERWRQAFWSTRTAIAQRRRTGRALPALWATDEADIALDALAALQALTGRSAEALLADPAVLAPGAPHLMGVPDAA